MLAARSFQILAVALVTLLLGCLTVMADNKEKEIDQLFRFCEREAGNFESVKSEFEHAFPVGSDVTDFVNAVKKNPGFRRAQWSPTLQPDKSRSASNSYVYALDYPCDLDHGNRDIWYIIIVTDLENKITQKIFRIFFEDENFRIRGIPFQFENFHNARSIQKALWSITGKGTPRDEVQRLMREAGITWRRAYLEPGKRFDEYRKFPDPTDPVLQFGGGRSWIMRWEISDTDQLEDLKVVE